MRSQCLVQNRSTRCSLPDMSETDDVKRKLGILLRRVMPLEPPRGLLAGYVDVGRKKIVFEVEADHDHAGVEALVRELPPSLGVVNVVPTREGF